MEENTRSRRERQASAKAQQNALEAQRNALWKEQEDRREAIQARNAARWRPTRQPLEINSGSQRILKSFRFAREDGAFTYVYIFDIEPHIFITLSIETLNQTFNLADTEFRKMKLDSVYINTRGIDFDDSVDGEITIPVKRETEDAADETSYNTWIVDREQFVINFREKTRPPINITDDQILTILEVLSKDITMQDINGMEEWRRVGDWDSSVAPVTEEVEKQYDIDLYNNFLVQRYNNLNSSEYVLKGGKRRKRKTRRTRRKTQKKRKTQRKRKTHRRKK